LGIGTQAKLWIIQQSKSPIAAIIITHALLLAPSNWLGASCQPLGVAQQLNSSKLRSCIMGTSYIQCCYYAVMLHSVPLDAQNRTGGPSKIKYLLLWG